MLLNKLLNKQNKSNDTKKVIPINWKKLIPGLSLIGFGLLFFTLYMENQALVVLGALAAVSIALGGYLVKNSFGEHGFTFSADGAKYTGNENAIVIYAKRNPDTRRDNPTEVIFKTIEKEKIPVGARLHYLKNTKRHYYELYYDPITDTLKPVVLPDKKSFPPGLFQIPAAMQTYKEALEYIPPTLLQKLAPGLILLGMGIVGILMLVTGDPNG